MATAKQLQDVATETAESYKIPYYISQAKIAYRVQDLVQILHISKDSVYKLFNSGELPSKKVSGTRLVEHGNLMKYLKEI